jgi:hypothetical protein
MFNRSMLVSAFLFIFGCGATQLQPSTPEEFSIRRQPVGDEYIYSSTSSPEDYLVVLDAHGSYYETMPSNLSGSVTFTVTFHPGSEALTSFYQEMPRGVEMRPYFFTLGAGDSYEMLRGYIQLDAPSIQANSAASEASFAFEAPSGIRAGFEMRMLEVHDGETGEPRYEVTDSTPCPSGDAFSVVMAHPDFGTPDSTVRYVGRSSRLNCRYTIDLVEGTFHIRT